MTIAFILSMPNRGSWNGRWSGEESIFAVFKKFSGKKGAERASKMLEQGYYSYNFGDGWRASIEVKQVEGSELRNMKKRTQGFCGYEWMVDSILRDGQIYGPTQPKPVTV